MWGYELTAEMDAAARQRGADFVYHCMHTAPGTDLKAGKLSVKCHDWRLNRGDYINVNAYVVYKGYWIQSDRAGTIGPVLDKAAAGMVEANLQVQDEVLRVIRPGLSIGELIEIGNRAAARFGYEIQGGRIGHGQGLDYSERPFLLAGSRELLQPGHVFVLHVCLGDPGGTLLINPIADLCYLTADGVEVLNKFPQRVVSPVSVGTRERITMNFRSDNESPAAPEILAALQAANSGHAYAYGEDRDHFRDERTLPGGFRDRTWRSCRWRRARRPTPCPSPNWLLPTAPSSATARLISMRTSAGRPEFYSGGAKVIPLSGELAKICPREPSDSPWPRWRKWGSMKVSPAPSASARRPSWEPSTSRMRSARFPGSLAAGGWGCTWTAPASPMPCNDWVAHPPS